MNGADYALLAVLAISMGVGLWRGFIVEVLSLTVWIGAFWLSIGFGADLAAWLDGVESPSARMFLGYAGVFLGVLVVGGLATWAIGKLIANTGLSGTDRVLGLGFGLLRGLVLACVAVLLLGFTPMPAEAWWSGSRLIPEVQRGAEWATGFLPPDALEHLHFSVPVPGIESLPGLPQEAATPEIPSGPSPDAAATPVSET